LGDQAGLTLAPPPPSRTIATVNRRFLIIGVSVLSALVLFLCTLVASSLSNHGASSNVRAMGPTATSAITATDVATATAIPIGGQATPVPAYAITEYDDAKEGRGHFQFHYHGTWQMDSGPGYYATTDRYSNDDKSGYVIFTFVGSRIQIIASKNMNAGIMGISLDNGSEIDKDGYSPTLTYQVVLYDSGPLVQSKHKVKIFVTGTKNPLATDEYINIDAAKVSA